MTEAAQALPGASGGGKSSSLVSSALAGTGLEPAGASPYRFLVAWAVGWAAIGAVVGAGIAYTRGAPEFLPLLRQSILFAEVVGFTSLASARLVFPYYARLPFAVRIALQVLTLLSGTVFGSVAILASQPLYALARPRTVAVLVLLNAAFAVIVGIALHTYDSMRRQIEQSYRVLREKEAMERELGIAREVQRELLPRSVPQVRGLQLAGACLPAVGVGGDLYDFLPFTEERVGLVIADVSGKGIPAALLMAGLQASVRSIARPTLDPSEVMRRLNEVLLRSTSAARYATMFFCHYDGMTRRLTYSNAGHYPPLLLGADGPTRLTEGGLPIGLLAEARYGEGECVLREGDLLALFTDGIVESPNAEDREFGEERLLGILAEHRDRHLDDIVGLVLDEVTRWRGGRAPHDDVTLVLARAT